MKILDPAQRRRFIVQIRCAGETESNSKAKRDILTVIENLTRIAGEL